MASPYQVRRNTTGYPSAFGGGPAKAASAYARRVQTTAAPRPRSQSLDEVANQRVDQQLNPQIAALHAFGTQQNQAIQAFAQALLGKLQPIAGQVGQSYDSAIQQQGALSGQAAQYLQGQNPSGPVAELLRAVGAPASQQQQVAGQLGQTFGGGAGVLAFTGGAIPGGQLAADKAAAVGEAAQLPGFAALRGQQDLAGALYQQKQDRMNLEATRPALYQQAAQDIRQNNAARNQAAAAATQNRVTNQRAASSAAESRREFNVTAAGKRTAAAVSERRYEQGQASKSAAAAQKQKQFSATQAEKRAAAAEKRREFDTANSIRLRAFDEKKKKDAAALLFKYGADPSTGVLTPDASAELEKQLKVAPGTFTGLSAADAVRKAHDQVLEKQGQQRVKVSQQNADTSATRANNAAASSAAARANAAARLSLAQKREAAYEKAQARKGKSAPKASSSLSAGNGYLTDTSGTPILRGGKRVPYKSASQQKPPKGRYNTSKIAQFRGNAAAGADHAYHGWSDKDGHHDPVDYQAAIQMGRQGGVPDEYLIPALNKLYAPGDRGRPQTKTTKAAAKFFAGTGRGFGG